MKYRTHWQFIRRFISGILTISVQIAKNQQNPNFKRRIDHNAAYLHGQFILSRLVAFFDQL